jgi:hypothetical protein
MPAESWSSMANTKQALLTAAVAYFLSLMVVTSVALIFFGSYSDIYVVPLEYLLPGVIALVAYVKTYRRKTSRTGDDPHTY